MEAKNLVFKLAKEKGFCDVGVCSADPFEEQREIFEKTAPKLEGFVERDIEKRIDPKLSMPQVKSIIVAAKSYNRRVDVKKDEAIRGYISIGAVGEDYHRFMERELGEIAVELSEKYGCVCMAFSDTGPLCDRELAIRSGIGYRGKSGAVITKNGGAAVFLGYILTSLKLTSDISVDKSCPNECTLCIKACPTGAISENGFQTEKCISYLTQKKSLLTAKEMKLIGNNLYGCDKCQIICPKNCKNDNTVTEIDDIMPRTEYILSLSNKTFKAKFGETAIFWRGNTIIKRNALAALGNIHNSDALRILSDYAQSENDFIKHSAIRSIINLGSKSGQAVLKNLLEKETNDEIRGEIKWAIGIPED